MPGYEHLAQALAFTSDLRAHDRLLVHCRHGIGRSTAMAIGVCVQHGMDAEQAYRHVERIRDCLLPNATIIALIDDRFGLANRLIDLVSRKREAKMRKILGDNASINNTDDVQAMKSFLEKHAMSRYSK